MRTHLTAPTSFYCNTLTGSLNNSGLTPTQALPQPQDILDRLQQQYDLGAMPIDIYGAAGQSFDGVVIFGSFVGSRGPSVTLHDLKIKPRPGKHGVALAFNACLKITNCSIDKSDATQDCIACGQGSDLWIEGTTKLIQNNPYTYNHFSIYEGSHVDVFGNVYFGGFGTVGIDADESSSFVAQCNGVHGLIAFYADSTGPGTPQWSDAFVDVSAGSKVDLAGVDFHGTGWGYKYRIREGGTLRLNLEADPNQVNMLFGSASTAWPFAGKGYLT